MKGLYNAEDFPLLVEGFAREGLNDMQIYAKLGIKKSAFYKYQANHIDFAEALKRGRKPVDTLVENALLKRALGYDYDEKTTEIEIGEDGNPDVTKVRTTKKSMPPDVGAATFWLKNRKKSAWRDKQEIGVTDVEGKDVLPTKQVMIINGKEIEF